MNPQWTQRLTVALLLLATGLPGLLFAPVFGLGSLVLPLVAVLLVCFVVAEVCARVSALRPWRPVLMLVLGLLALGELEFGPGLPDAAMLRGLLDGVTRSWQLTLQSTWPARAEAELFLFVPLAVLFAAVLGVELLRLPAVALLPGLAVAGLSQAYVALSGPVATVAGLAYVVVSGALLAVTRRRGSRLILVLPAVVLAVAVSAGITAVDQGSRPSLALEHETAPVPPLRVDNPLDEVADRLTRPAEPVFGYTGTAGADRWRIAVLTEFDGVSWRANGAYLRLGATLGTATQHARITVPDGNGPWLPSQPLLATVAGADPLVDPGTGALLLPGRRGPVEYELGWREPAVAPGDLLDAGIDASAVSGGVGQVPPGVSELARTATGGLRPSFRAALVLERYLAEHYRQATGPVLPTGSGWAQLNRFLFTARAGTSEQFATAYAALARLIGIPARVAVGFRAPPGGPGPVTVHNGDSFAWPEVAVAGVGWVPLDPAGGASHGAAAAAGALAQATDQARDDLPPPQRLRDPEVPPDEGGTTGSSGSDEAWIGPLLAWLGLGVVSVLVFAVVAIPGWRAVRTARRRRRTGSAAVVAAWLEARDVLRAHDVIVSRGATARELARRLPSTVDKSVAEGLEWLARQVDIALWSPVGADDRTAAQAWSAVRAIRKGLTVVSFRARIRAVFDLGSLRGPGIVAE
ncbi:transglutaminase-like domain-containing protein [Amycolatopsis sp. lyj-90]|uniref:transglutaminase-like domain-containing protein n=1 Tax=Amycolatopsis sp. lyj-90 TaxID=2789285 RepID=UPI0039798547